MEMETCSYILPLTRSWPWRYNINWMRKSYTYPLTRNVFTSVTEGARAVRDTQLWLIFGLCRKLNALVWALEGSACWRRWWMDSSAIPFISSTTWSNTRFPRKTISFVVRMGMCQSATYQKQRKNKSFTCCFWCWLGFDLYGNIRTPNTYSHSFSLCTQECHGFK